MNNKENNNDDDDNNNNNNWQEQQILDPGRKWLFSAFTHTQNNLAPPAPPPLPGPSPTSAHAHKDSNPKTQDSLDYWIQFLNACLNKQVLRLFLNDGREGDLRISTGKEFQTPGVWNRKDLTPAVSKFTLGVDRSWTDQDLSDLEGVSAVSPADK